MSDGNVAPMRRSRLTLSAVLLVALVGCTSDGGGTSEQVERATPVDTDITAGPVSGSGNYEFAHGGATGVVTVPTSVSDARVAEYEAYRQSAGAIEVTYVVTEIDNTGGADVVTMYKIVIVTGDGSQIEVPPIGVRLETWRDAFSAPGTSNAEAYNRGVALHEAVTSVKPGTRGRLINAAAQLVPSVARVFVYPTGGIDRVEAVQS